jgi:hypothetical protein|tara:strand:- start:164 stop:325 length:162 start_codon:yes stop_codon:yes gene_type:complete
MRTGFIFGLGAATGIIVPLLLIDHFAILPAALVFLSGGLFAISVRKFARGDQG